MQYSVRNFFLWTLLSKIKKKLRKTNTTTNYYNATERPEMDRGRSNERSSDRAIKSLINSFLISRVESAFGLIAIVVTVAFSSRGRTIETPKKSVAVTTRHTPSSLSRGDTVIRF